MNRGVVHLLLLIIIPILILVIVGGVVYNSYKKGSKNESVMQNEDLGNSSSQDSSQDLEVDEKTATSPTPTTQKSTPTSKPIKLPTNTPTSTTQSYTGVCQVNVLAGSNPNEVVLTYGLTASDGRYMKEARWDLDNNGQWDHDFNSANAQVTTNLSGGNNKTVRLQLKLSDDTLTGVCTKSVTTPSGTWITIWGHVFSDNNCSGFMDEYESGIANVPVRITNTSNYSTYATTNTDGSGKYSYTTLLNDLIEMTVSMTSPPGYKSHPTHVIGSNLMGYGKNTNVQKNIPQVPYASVGQCSF